MSAGHCKCGCYELLTHAERMDTLKHEMGSYSSRMAIAVGALERLFGFVIPIFSLHYKRFWIYVFTHTYTPAFREPFLFVTNDSHLFRSVVSGTVPGRGGRL